MKYTVYTDGACSGNPGPGACASFILETNQTITKSFKLTTNNRMELSAILLAFMELNEGAEIQFITDSKYVVDAVNEGWVYKWKEEAFLNRPNGDLWIQLLFFLTMYKCTFSWVKGHNMDESNEFVDKLARKAINKEPIFKDKIYEDLYQTLSKRTPKI